MMQHCFNIYLINQLYISSESTVSTKRVFLHYQRSYCIFANRFICGAQNIHMPRMRITQIRIGVRSAHGLDYVAAEGFSHGVNTRCEIVGGVWPS